MDYVCRYRKYYPADTSEEVWCDIPMQEGYAMIAGAMSMDGWLAFSGIKLADGGYLGDEVRKLAKKL